MGAVKTISDRIPHAYDRKGRYGLWTVAQIWDNGGGNPCGKTLIDPDDLVVDAVLTIPLGFPLVPQMVKYTSVLTQWIVEGLVVRYPFLSTGVIGKSVMGKDIHSLWIGTGEK